MWKVTQHKNESSKQGLKVAIAVKEMAQSEWISTVDGLEIHLKSALKNIPAQNNFSADLMYKLTQRNLQSAEVWKLTAQGDFKYKIFTLDYVPQT